jgi:hypothetical protein
MYVWDAASGQLEKSVGVYTAGRNIITKSGNQCEADEDAKQLKETLEGKLSSTEFNRLHKILIGFLGSN